MMHTFVEFLNPLLQDTNPVAVHSFTQRMNETIFSIVDKRTNLEVIHFTRGEASIVMIPILLYLIYKRYA